jgi:hypothetical protein
MARFWRVLTHSVNLLATLSAASTMMTDTGVSPNTTYSYQVTAFNTSGSSMPSNTATVTTPSATPTTWDCLRSVTPAAHHSTLPKTTNCVAAFSDQISGGLSDLYVWFAATHFAGVQKMLKNDNDRFRTHNPNWVLVHYQLGMGASPAQYIRGVMVNGSLESQWSASWPFVNSQESWFMHNSAGVRHCGPNSYNCILNISDANVRSWWLAEAMTAMRAAGAQGVFADTFLEGISGYDVVRPDTRFEGTNPGNPSVWPNGVTWLDQRTDWLNTIAQAFAQAPEQFLLIPNIGSQATSWDTTDFAATSIDGAMLEGVALDTRYTPDWQLEMNRALPLTSAGKIVIFQTYPAGNHGTATFDQNVDYAMASYLLIKGDYTYISLLGGNTATGTGIFYYPQYEAVQALGAAVTPVPANISSYSWGGMYRRDFQNGMVLVNSTATAISVTLPDEYQQVQCNGGGEVGSRDIDPVSFDYVGGSCTGATVNSVTVGAWSGTMLLNSGVAIP